MADKLSFPLALDLAPLLAAEAAPDAAPAHEQQYELAAILIHKGPSASHGHYGARQLLHLAVRSSAYVSGSSALMHPCSFALIVF